MDGSTLGRPPACGTVGYWLEGLGSIPTCSLQCTPSIQGHFKCVSDLYFKNIYSSKLFIPKSSAFSILTIFSKSPPFVSYSLIFNSLFCTVTVHLRWQSLSFFNSESFPNPFSFWVLHKNYSYLTDLIFIFLQLFLIPFHF